MKFVAKRQFLFDLITTVVTIKLMNPLDLPQYILYQYPEANITHLKLQKLLYYIKVWGIVAGKNLYAGTFHKWKYGPVNVEVYYQYKDYGQDDLTVPETALLPDHERKPLIDFILDVYMPYRAISLSAMTHREPPWQNTPDQAVISDEQIYTYYAQQSFARNFNPFDPEHKPFYVVQSNSWYAFVLDMTAEDVQRHTQTASYQAYKERQQRAKDEIGGMLQRL